MVTHVSCPGDGAQSDGVQRNLASTDYRSFASNRQAKSCHSERVERAKHGHELPVLRSSAGSIRLAPLTGRCSVDRRACPELVLSEAEGRSRSIIAGRPPRARIYQQYHFIAGRPWLGRRVMTTEQRDYLAYMLRLWQVNDDGKPVWRASVESPHTGERHGFQPGAAVRVSGGKDGRAHTRRAAARQQPDWVATSPRRRARRCGVRRACSAKRHGGHLGS